MRQACLCAPDVITVFTATRTAICFQGPGEREGVVLTLTDAHGGLTLSIASDLPLAYVKVRWNHPFQKNTRFCGDAWERTYGDSQWRLADPARSMPWYFLAATPDRTEAFGVRVRPHALATWTCDRLGPTLWLDVRSGTNPLRLKGRILDLATIISATFTQLSPFEAAKQFCAMMCTDPLLPPAPVYGSNNWYYAYSNITHQSVLDDGDYLAELTEGLQNRPYMVIDDGWQEARRPDYNGGPWTRGNEKFPDMKRLADELKAKNVKPGIWYRPLYLERGKCTREIPDSWRMSHEPNVLDPSLPDVLDRIKSDVSRFADWGYQLLKHDFTTYDQFGRYGFDMRFFPPAEQVTFKDQSLTSAEIVLQLYQAIREAAGDMMILGCNTIPHLGAGLMHLSRTGDDTSGRKWERTRKMGVNSLAFRLCQNKTFFSGDADCVGITGKIPWSFNRQWSELLATSGTAYFCSVKPGILSSAGKKELSKHLRIASRQQETVQPLDWMETTVPEHWLAQDGERTYDWFDEQGDLPDFIEL